MDPDPLGLFPLYQSALEGRCSGDPLLLVQGEGDVLEWDRKGVKGYLDRAPDGVRTCFEGVSVVGTAATPPAAALAPLEALLIAIETCARRIRRGAIALSGGLDSALVAVLLREAGVELPIYTVTTAVPGYCEGERTLAVAKRLGVGPVRELRLEMEDFIEALPDTVVATGCPIWNLHMASKLLLAERLAADGFKEVWTGDGADQVFAGTDGRNYLPLVGSIFRARRVSLLTPFNDPGVVASATADPNKSQLRKLARRWLPRDIAQIPKKSTLAPPLDVSRFYDPGAIESIAAATGLTPRLDTPWRRCLWTSLGLLRAAALARR